MKVAPTLLAVLLLAAPAAVYSQFAFVTNADNTLTITNYTGPGGDVIIPTNYNGMQITGIGDSAFYFCMSLTSITIPASVTSIGDGAFWDCFNMTDAGIPSTVTNMGDGAFQDCFSLTGVMIPSGVKRVGDSAFFECVGLTNIMIPDSVTNIGVAAFGDCANLTSVTIPRSVTILGEEAFDNCSSLRTVVIPGGVTSIGYSTFYNCTSLAKVIIFGSLTNIGDSAFSGCTSLRQVYFQGNAPGTLGTNVFSGDKSATLYYSPGASGWSDPFAGLAAVLWNPLIQSRAANFGVHDNQFWFSITGTPGIPIVVEVCADLTSPFWTPLQTLTLTNGSANFSEPVQPNTHGRYYRIRSP